MQPHYLSRLRLALVRFRSKLSLSAIVDHIESRCSWMNGPTSALWYKGEVLDRLSDYNSVKGRKHLIRQWLQRKLLVNAGWSIVLATVLTWAILS